MKYLLSTLFLSYSLLSEGQTYDTTHDSCSLKFNNDNWPPYVIPNSENLEEATFRIDSNCELAHFKLFIFNRWGEILYESENIKDGWDVTSKGEIVIDGTYTWKVEFSFEGDEIKMHFGHFNVIN